MAAIKTIDEPDPSQGKHFTEASASPGDDKPSSDEKRQLQHGVQSALAVAEALSRRQLIIAYVNIWCIQFVLIFSYGITRTLTPYVTSSFQEHSLTATTTIVASLIGGLTKLPYAKLLDIWGRPQGFAVMIVLITIGNIMMAACQDVRTYCAAQVFYSVGFNGILFTLTIFIVDTSSLRNRAFSMAFTASSSLATVWMYGPTVTSILKTIGIRWGFGIWAIIIPVTCAPLASLLWLHQRKVEKAGLMPSNTATFGVPRWIAHYCREFDIPGLLLISSGLSLFLLSFSLYSYQAEGWKSPLIICFVIIGAFLIVTFALYERYLAPVTFVPWRLLRNRTVIFTFVMVGSLYITVALWGAYYYSYLIVVYNQSITHATYIQNIYTVASCFWSMMLGVLFRYYGRIKLYTLFMGLPLTMLGVGLMINFRFPDSKISYTAMCQIFIAFGGGTTYLTEQITLMAVSAQQHIPAVLALEAMVIQIGEAVGSTIATAIWTGVFPKKLLQYLPRNALPMAPQIYGSLVVQASYPVGTPERLAIDHAYGDTQRLMLITSICILAVSLASVVFWEDVDVKKMKKRETDVF